MRNIFYLTSMDFDLTQQCNYEQYEINENSETQFDNEFTMELLFDENKENNGIKNNISIVSFEKSCCSNNNENEENEEDKDDNEEIDEVYRYFIERHSNTEIRASPIEMGGSAPEERNKCPGCFPVFQLNQEAHIGPCGCLGDW